MRLDRAWIECHIPHRGRMCLLDEVVGWDAERISCRSASHRAADNPLRADGQIGIACGIEYAAQAMAVHGALLADTHAAGWDEAPDTEPGLEDAPGRGTDGARGAAVAAGSGAAVLSSGGVPAGFLAGVRGVQFHVARLDDVPGDLICIAVRVAGNRGTALYDFELRCGEVPLLRGRATVLLDARGRMQT